MRIREPLFQSWCGKMHAGVRTTEFHLLVQSFRNAEEAGYENNPEMQWRTRNITVSRHKIHIYVQGDKNAPPIVFMAGHCTVAPVYDFKVLYEKLLQDFRVIVQQRFAATMEARLISYDCGHYIRHFKNDEMSKEIIEFANASVN